VPDAPGVTMATKSFANTPNIHIWKLETSVRGVEGSFIITKLTGLSVLFLLMIGSASLQLVNNTVIVKMITVGVFVGS